MVALEEEIGTPIEITAIYWHRGLPGGSRVEFDDFHIYIGYCIGDSLETSFEENWLAGSRVDPGAFGINTMSLSGLNRVVKAHITSLRLKGSMSSSTIMMTFG